MQEVAANFTDHLPLLPAMTRRSMAPRVLGLLNIGFLLALYRVGVFASTNTTTGALQTLNDVGMQGAAC